MNRIILVLTILFTLGLCGISSAQTNVCNNPSQVQSVVVSITSNTTTKLAANIDTTKAVIPCAFNLSIVGAATPQTLVFEYGSGTNCGTGTTVLTGAISGDLAASIKFLASSINPFKKIPSGKDLCLVTTTNDKVAGSVTFVIQ